MAGLSAAILGANSALSNASRQSTVVSSNIAGVNVSGYAKKTLLLETGPDGYAEAVAIGRATDKALQTASFEANSKSSGATALSSIYDQLEQVMGASSSSNPMALLSGLQNSLQQMTSQPSNVAAATTVISQAQSVVDGLHKATDQIIAIRQQANAQLSDAATNLNKLLDQFSTVNSTIVAGQNSTTDTTPAQDQRDSILGQIAQYVGISTVNRSDGSMAIYTDSGVTLFDSSPRTVSITATGNVSPGVAGPVLTIGGVDVTSANSPMQVKSGSIASLANARDVVAVKAQSQLDEVARNLINAFAESDRSASPTQPTQPGLFTYSGAPAMPGSSLVPGLAGEISVASSLSSNPMLIRDGGISSPSSVYTANTTGATDFADRINEMIAAFSTTQTFDASVSTVTSASITSYASSTMNLFESARQTASQNSDQMKATADRATQALSNATGVNLDDETSHMLEIQRSYQTAAKMISTINDMFTSLLQAMPAA